MSGSDTKTIKQFVELHLRNRQTGQRSAVRITIRTEGESSLHDRYSAMLNFLAGAESGNQLSKHEVELVRACRPRVRSE